MAEHVEKSTIQGVEVTYPPSWIDRLIDWIDALPGPSWLFYVLSTLALAFLGHVLFWIDGSIPFGSFDRLLILAALFEFYWLALYQYLTRVGSRCLQTFRPLLEVDDFEFARIDYELATLPRWLGRLAIPLGLGFAALTIFGEPEPFGEIVPRTALPYLAEIAITGFLIITFFFVVIRSVRQLWMVRELHARATNVNLLKLDPAHAFSALTARTGIGIILLVIFGYILVPSQFSTTLDIFISVGATLLSIAVFVMPVMGMRDHLEKEKERVLNETSNLLQSASDDLHSKVSRRAYHDFGGIEDSISALIRERELLERIPTWPWDSRTIRGFASAMLLPIFLWLVTRLLERFL